MELFAVAATAASLAFVVAAYRQRRARIVATGAGALSLFATLGFVLFVHRISYALPPPPAEPLIGTTAPDFTLPDDAGNPVTLSSLRGHMTLLVFYRGYW
jgi:cytochrome oxidase Cu insertion factor (SCO1/SenC/PrrC family)